MTEPNRGLGLSCFCLVQDSSNEGSLGQSSFWAGRDFLICIKIWGYSSRDCFLPPSLSQVSDQRYCLNAFSALTCISRLSSFTGITYCLCVRIPHFIARRQDPPRAKWWRLTLLRYFVVCGGLEPIPQYLQGMPGLSTSPQSFLHNGIGAWKCKIMRLAFSMG